MNESKESPFTLPVNVALWLSVALFLIGVVETLGFVEVVAQEFRFPLVGPVIVTVAIALFTYPLKVIKKEIQKERESKL